MLNLSWTTRLAVATLCAVVAAGCGGDNSSGLATLQGATSAAPDEVLSAQNVDEPLAGTGTAKRSDQITSDSTVANPAVADTAAEEGAAITGAASEADSENEPGDLTDEERLLEFAQCMRDQGVDFPDPVVEADGTIAFGRRPGGGGGQNGDSLQAIGRDPDLPAAREACSEIIEGLALGRGGQNLDETRIELLDRLLEFAQCMRDHGVDVPDPDPNSFGPGGGGGRPFGELDLDDADVSMAFDACREQLPTGPRLGGGR